MANPAPSTPPTDPNDYVRQMRAKLRAMFGLQRPTVEEAVQTVKNICKLLMSYGVLDAAASYDGNGNSGEMNVSVKYEQRTPVLIGHSISTANESSPFSAAAASWCNIDYFFRNIVKEKDTLVTQKTIDDLQDALLQLLPEYWDHDDGGYGEIEIDVVRGEIRIEHNERVVEVRTTTKTY